MGRQYFSNKIEWCTGNLNCFLNYFFMCEGCNCNTVVSLNFFCTCTNLPSPQKSQSVSSSLSYTSDQVNDVLWAVVFRNSSDNVFIMEFNASHLIYFFPPRHTSLTLEKSYRYLNSSSQWTKVHITITTVSKSGPVVVSPVKG